MATTPSRTLLLIADISGYTRFVRMHALANNHARQIIVRLLKALVGTARPPLKVAELEGDAVFFYAAAGQDEEEALEQAKHQILQFYRAFALEIDALEKLTVCVCEACRNVRQLKLKQVVHCGEVSIERIDRFEKLFGLDVILVHRMLKNSVPAPEYLMMTEPAYTACTDFFELEPERRVEELEGLGPTPTLVFYGDHLAPLVQALPDTLERPSLLRVFLWKLKMHARSVPAAFRARTERESAPLAEV